MASSPSTWRAASTPARHRRAPGPRRSPPRPGRGWARGRAARAPRRAGGARARQTALGGGLGRRRGSGPFLLAVTAPADFLAPPSWRAPSAAPSSPRPCRRRAGRLGEPALEGGEIGLGRETERTELALHLVLHELAQVVAATPAHLEHLVDGAPIWSRARCPCATRSDDDRPRLRTAQLGELHAGLEHPAPVGGRLGRQLGVSRPASVGIFGGMVGPLHAGASTRDALAYGGRSASLRPAGRYPSRSSRDRPRDRAAADGSRDRRVGSRP